MTDFDTADHDPDNEPTAAERKSGFRIGSFGHYTDGEDAYRVRIVDFYPSGTLVLRAVDEQGKDMRVAFTGIDPKLFTPEQSNE